MGLRAMIQLRPGQTVLVQGASGGVGAILSRWAKALGATVIGVAGNAAKLDKVRAGAQHALHAGDPEALAKLRAIAPGGVDVVFDFVGQAVLDLTLAALRDGGALLAIGAASGQARIDPALLARRGITLHAGGTPQYVNASNAAEAAGELFQAMRADWFDDLPIVPYPLAQAAQAHEDLGRRALDGLPILVPPTSGEDEAIRIADTFFGHWNANRIDAALAMLADDVLYDNVPLPKMTGRADVEKFHRGFGIGSDYALDWKVVHQAAAGNVVLNERIDTFIHRDGGRIVLPVMGTLTVEHGKISVWRDYFDLADFERQLKDIRSGAPAY
jgi:limonene-1,2-epoxide hydrolase